MGLITTGGGLTNLRLRKANTQPSDVIWGKTFYAGDKNLKTGTLDDRPAISDAISLSNDGPSNLYARFPKGAYRTAASGGYPEVRIPMYLALGAIPGGNKGSWGTTISPGGSVTIPQGYHDGSGRVSAGLPGKQDIVYIYDSDLSPYIGIFTYRNTESWFTRHYSNGGDYSDELIRIHWDGASYHWFWNIYATANIGYQQDGGETVYLSPGQPIVENMDHAIVRWYKIFAV